MTRERMCSKRGGSGCIYLVLYVLVLYCMLLPQARCSGSLTETWARPIGAHQAAPPAGQQQLPQPHREHSVAEEGKHTRDAGEVSGGSLVGVEVIVGTIPVLS
jgi:hypothetical protein